MNNDKALMNVYLFDGGEKLIEQTDEISVGSNDDAVTMTVASSDWQSLTGKIATPAGAYILTVTVDGAELKRLDN